MIIYMFAVPEKDPDDFTDGLQTVFKTTSCSVSRRMVQSRENNCTLHRNNTTKKECSHYV